MQTQWGIHTYMGTHVCCNDRVNIISTLEQKLHDTNEMMAKSFNGMRPDIDKFTRESERSELRW